MLTGTNNFQRMSHINDLTGVLRGLRLVVEAGIKTQREATGLIWNNSSLKPLLQNCPSTNPLALNTNPAALKDYVERALVITHGFRQYAVMQVPYLKTDVEKAEMDPQVLDEIEELNREFNRTFETLNKDDAKISLDGVSSDQIVSPMDKLKKHAEMLKSQMVEPELVIQAEPVMTVKQEPVVIVEPEPVKIVQPPVSSHSTSKDNTPPVPKPVAKKKLKTSVSNLILSTMQNIFIS